jgi:hypothetical protein
MLLTVTGRKTGKRYPMPVSYARDGDLIICSTDRTRADWWKNLRGGATVTLWLCGKEVTGQATVISEDRQALISGIDVGPACVWSRPSRTARSPARYSSAWIYHA